MKRRALLASLGTVSTGVLAGCIADDGDPTTDAGDGAGGGDGDGTGDTDDGESAGDRTDTPTDDSPGTETGDSTPNGEGEPADPDVEPSLIASDVETVETGCADGDEADVSVEFGADGVRVDGVATTPDQCREAVVESAAIESGALNVELGFESTADVCTDCVGAIEYEARFDVDGVDGLDTVTVTHGDDGGTFGVSRASDEARPPEETPTADTASDAPPGTARHGSNEPDPDLPILVENRHGEDHEITVTVVRESGETVHDETHELAAESNSRAFNLKDADPDGIEEFHVRTATGDQTDGARVKTSDCYGRVIVAVTADGDLDVTYSVC